MKSQMHIPRVTTLSVPESQGHSVGRRRRVSGLIVGLALLALVALGAIALGGMAAADSPVLVADANPDVGELDRLYGTYTSQWNGLVAYELGATSARRYGTYTSQWNGMVERELGATSARQYGTYTGQWNGMVDRELGRHYGTFAGAWYTNFAAR